MKISFKALAEFLDSPNAYELLQKKKSQLRVDLPLAGLEIGEIKSGSEGLEKVLIAQILEFEKHPKADRLNVCQVAVGNSQPNLQIVCGAPNVKAGMKVALAPVGAVLPGNFAIKEAEIRGVKSFGMLCSEKELGLSSESNGIMELSDSAPVGSLFVKAMGLDDDVWDFELTPDRGDCLSHRGMAREISRQLGIHTKIPEIDIVSSGESQNDVALLSVEVNAKDACQSYGLQLFESVQNGPSPDWLKRRLESLGVRSHSSVVDITNLSLMEWGHPVHAFDADKIKGSRLIVRFAKAQEKLKTLDGELRNLSPEDLVIADSEGPVALAGVMGGFESSVTAQTQRVILECAVFDPMVVRAMSKRHKLQTDSSYRFERGVDIQARMQVVGRVSLLLKQLCRAKRRGAFVELIQSPFEKQALNLDLRMFRNVTGIMAEAEELQKAYAQVEIESSLKTSNVLKVDLPSHRFDLKREIDLIEEGARLLGYNKIPPRYPAQNAPTHSNTRTLYEKLKNIRQAALESGLSEVKPYCFVSQKQLNDSAVDLKSLVEIENPLSEEWTFLRPSHFWGQISVLARQKSLGAKRFGGFDIGNCFYRSVSESESQKKYSTGVRESVHLSWSLLGQRYLEHWSMDKKQSDRKADVDYFDAKGILEYLVEVLSVVIDSRWRAYKLVTLSESKTMNLDLSWIPVADLHPGRSAIVAIPGEKGFVAKGYVGELNPRRKGALLNLATGFDTGVVLGELRLIEDFVQESELPATLNKGPGAKLVASKRIPVVERDLAFVVSSDVKAGDMMGAFKKLNVAELLEVDCVDLYKLSDSQNSLAFRYVLQGVEDTLSEVQISEIVARFRTEAEKKFKAELR